MNQIKLPTAITRVLKKMRKVGCETYLVGGAVRDLLLAKTTDNWDFTTNAKPEEILKIFKDAHYDNKFGTVGVPQKDGTVFEITTFRSEKGYSDHRHPDKVSWGKTLEEDLSRRDFTINAIAYDGNKIIDPFNGQEDLEKKLIKTVSDPNQRFAEDALRLLRAIRLATQLGFTIDPPTFDAIRKNKAAIKLVSAERVRDELFKILASDFAADGILLLKGSGLLEEILPELTACFGVDQQSPKRHHIYDVGTHLLLSLKHCKSNDPIVKLATLLHDVGKPRVYQKTPDGVITFYNHETVGTRMIREIAQRLRLSKKEREKLVTLVRWHQFSVDEHQTDKALRRFIKRIGSENIEDMLILRTADRLGGGARETSWRLELFKKRLGKVQEQPFTVVDLKINGHDIMKFLNIPPGPQIGKILNRLFAEVEEDLSRNNRDYLLERLRVLKKTKSGVATKGEE